MADNLPTTHKSSHSVPQTYHWIDTDDVYYTHLPEWERASIIALDTESDNYHAYNPTICLLQLATPDAQYVIDTLAVSNEALRNLDPLLSDPDVVKILHGADNDLAFLANQYDLHINGLFDTILAARFLNFPKRGLSDLLEHYFQVQSSKQYQRYDWSTRPLLQEALDYAVQDVRYLIPLYEELKDALQQAKRWEAVCQESELLTERDFTPKTFDPFHYRKVKGAKQLSRQQQGVLYSLYMWRHKQCTKVNRAAFMVLDNAALLSLAQHQPRNTKELQRTPRVHSRAIRQFGGALLDAIQDGKNTPPPTRPRPRPSGKTKTPTHELERQNELYDALRQWREHASEETRLEMDLVMTNATLQELSREQPREIHQLTTIPGMTQWRIQAFGETILELIQKT